jgi:hypothetical protein
VNKIPTHLSRVRSALISHLPRSASKILFVVGALVLISCTVAVAYAGLWFLAASTFGNGVPPIIEGFRPPKTVTYEVECQVDNCGGTSFWHMDEDGFVESFVPTHMNYGTSRWSVRLSWYVLPQLSVYPGGRNTCRISVDGTLTQEYHC